MKKYEIEENLWCFQLDASDPEHLGSNIYALIDNKDVLLIDTGYVNQMAEVLDALMAYNIQIVIPSHYHPDHIDGARLIKNVKRYGNEHAEAALLKYMPDDIDLKPTHLTNGETFRFGNFEIELIEASGHSECSFLTRINNRYVHVGDLYMTRNTGKDVLPYVTYDNIEKHIDSLDKIKSLAKEQILLSHGQVKVDKDRYLVGIKDRKMYLKTILESHNKCSIDEAIEHLKKPFDFHKWRDQI